MTPTQKQADLIIGMIACVAFVINGIHVYRQQVYPLDRWIAAFFRYLGNQWKKK